MTCTALRRLIRAGRNNGRHRRRPECLALEDRRLLATINVTSAADDGSANTLRWAIGMANTADTPTSIDIELGTSPATITLELGQLELTNTAQPITIYDGAGQGPVSISGNDESSVFDIDANVTATLSGLTITGGSTQGQWRRAQQRWHADVSWTARSAGIRRLPERVCTTPAQPRSTDCTISGNSSAGSGGGLFNLGNRESDRLHHHRQLLLQETAAGRAAGSVSVSAIPAAGTAAACSTTERSTLTNCTLSGNTAVNGGRSLRLWRCHSDSPAPSVTNISRERHLATAGIFAYAYENPSTSSRDVNGHHCCWKRSAGADFGYSAIRSGRRLSARTTSSALTAGSSSKTASTATSY